MLKLQMVFLIFYLKDNHTDKDDLIIDWVIFISMRGHC